MTLDTQAAVAAIRGLTNSAGFATNAVYGFTQMLRKLLKDHKPDGIGIAFDRTIDVQVGRLRRKLEDDPEKPNMIKTVRGTGYIFTPTVEIG